jgi:NTE family protein
MRHQPADARRGILLGLGSTIPARGASPEFQTFVARYPEHRTYEGKDLARFPTVFDKLPAELVELLVYRGWWLTGAALARYQADIAQLPPDTVAPQVRA